MLRGRPRPDLRAPAPNSLGWDLGPLRPGHRRSCPGLAPADPRPPAGGPSPQLLAPRRLAAETGGGCSAWRLRRVLSPRPHHGGPLADNIRIHRGLNQGKQLLSPASTGPSWPRERGPSPDRAGHSFLPRPGSNWGVRPRQFAPSPMAAPPAQEPPGLQGTHSHDPQGCPPTAGTFLVSCPQPQLGQPDSGAARAPRMEHQREARVRVEVTVRAGPTVWSPCPPRSPQAHCVGTMAS